MLEIEDQKCMSTLEALDCELYYVARSWGMRRSYSSSTLYTWEERRESAIQSTQIFVSNKCRRVHIEFGVAK